MSILFLTGLVSCAGDKNDEPADSAFKIGIDQFSFPQSGGDKEIAIQSAVKPEVSSDAEWLTVAEIIPTGSKGNLYKVTLHAQANPDADTRSSEVMVTAGANSGSVSVTQAGSGFRIIEDNLTGSVLSMSGASVPLSFTVAGPYEVAVSDNWIAATEESKLDNIVTLKVQVGLNMGDAREGEVKITSGGASISLPVSQEAFVAAPADKSGMESTAMQLAGKLGAGFNIGNTFDSHPNGETSWGNPVINRTFIKGLADAGVGTVRLPVTWYQFADDSYTISPAALNRVREVVGWILEEGMYVIINTHHDDVVWLKALGLNDSEVKKIDERFRAYWQQIALAFRDYDERVIFAGLNEPEPGRESDDKGTVGEMGGLAVYEQSFVDVVRSTGGRNAYRCLVVQAPFTNTDNFEKFGTMPTDNVPDRLMGELHYYPWLFTLKEEDGDQSWSWMKFFWGKENKAAAEALTEKLAGHTGAERWDATTEEDVIAELDRMKRLYCDQGYPMILGEYGAIMNRDKFLEGNQAALDLNHKSRRDFNYFVAREAYSRGLIPCLWDTGEAVSRSTGEISKDYLLPPVVQGVKDASYPY